MADLLTKKEVKEVLKKNPHKWIWNEWGTDLICLVSKTNMEGMDDTCVEVRVEDLSELGRQDRRKLKLKTHTVNNRLMYYAPKSWFKETIIYEAEQVSEGHWVRCFDVNGNPEDKTTYMNLPKYASIVVCPHCKELRKVFSHCSKNLPFWVKVRSYINDSIRSSSLYRWYRRRKGKGI